MYRFLGQDMLYNQQRITLLEDKDNDHDGDEQTYYNRFGLCDVPCRTSNRPPY